MMDTVISASRISFFSAGQISKIINAIPYHQQIICAVRTLNLPVQNLGLGLYGAKELVFDRMKPFEEISDPTAKQKINKLQIFIYNFLHKREFEKIPFGFHPMHGALYLSSGVCGLASCIEFGASKAFAFAGNGLFFMSNIITLDYNITLYEEADSIDLRNAPKYVHEAVKRLKTSAIMGMIGSLGYILASISAISGIYLALTICLTGIAITTACIKILYDYFYLS
jgi:hypothetical protein